MPPAGIYISVPFCARKCAYCNFASGVFPREWIGFYIEGVAGELENLVASREAAPREAETLYFGGGSPSMLSAEQFAALSGNLPAKEWAEATIEVVPGDVDMQRIRAWAKAGIDRASLGVQSFVSEVARAAGRRHAPQTVRSDIARLRRSGIRNIAVDLIAGLAHQTHLTWEESLSWVGRLEVDHVSVYMLEVDDASRLGKELRSGGSRYGAGAVPGDDRIAEFYLRAVERLRGLGYERYEVSNFARAGKRSRHNLKYWRMEPYFGCGSDAHSFDGERRWANVETAEEYISLIRRGFSPRKPVERLDERRRLEERILTGLRTTEGVALTAGERKLLSPESTAGFESGRLLVEGQTLRLSNEGFLFADAVVSDLLT